MNAPSCRSIPVLTCAAIFATLIALPSLAQTAAPADGKVPPARGSLEDLDRALQTLNADGAGVPDIRFVAAPAPTSPTAASAAPRGPAGPAVPRGWRPREVALDPPAREGLAMSEAWSQTPSLPAPGPDGRVLYVYGEGLPTLVCAPLRLCVIELEAGEQLLGEPQIGDAVRWVVSATRSGGGAGRTPTDLLVVKPRAIGLDTTLLVPTDRRAYYLRLLSRSDRYMARIAFDYGAETDRALEQQIATLAARPAAAPEPRIATDLLDFGYRWEARGRHRAIAPRRVFDDGAKTFIELDPALSAGELPVLVLVGPEGRDETVNYRVRGSRFIVDRRIERAALIRGAGRHAERVLIEREPGAPPGPPEARADAPPSMAATSP